MNKSTELFSNPSYNPGFLLDYVIGRLKLKNDAALSRVLKINAPAICNIRAKRLPVGNALLISLHDVTGLPIKVLRTMGGIPS